MKASILVLASIFFAPVALAQPSVDSPPAEKIKILSWNIYMLPGFLGHGKVPRAEAIGQLLTSSDYDVIVFQEAFHKKARKTISRLISPAFPFQAGPANQKLLSVKTNSGLWVMSRYPIVEVHSIIFKTRKGIDAMSRKGGLMAEIKVPGGHVQIIGTHLQNAGGSWRRQSQCVELYHRLLNKYQRADVPQIVCGDFNINKYSSGEDYRFMIQTLDANDGASTEKMFSYDRVNNDLQIEPGAQQDLIDYILVRPNHAQLTCGERKIQTFRQRWHSRHQDLSDHYSIELEVHLTGHEVYTVAR